MHLAASHCSDWQVALMISQQTLVGESAYVWGYGREVQVVEVCHALRMHAAAGEEAATTTLPLLSALWRMIASTRCRSVSCPVDIWSIVGDVNLQ
jgi:hypothetical protein